MLSSERDLVLRILEYYFGETVSRIAGHLLLSGPITLHKLASSSSYSFKVVRNTLLILIKHGIVNYDLESSSIGHIDVTHVLYSLSCNNVLSLLLIPYVFLISQDDLDSDSSEVLLQIAKAGIVSLGRVKKALSNIAADVIEESIFKFLDKGLIVVCQSFQQRQNGFQNGESTYNTNSGVLDNLANNMYTLSSGAGFTMSDSQLYKINTKFISESLLKEELKLLMFKRIGGTELLHHVLEVLMKKGTQTSLSYKEIESKVMKSVKTTNVIEPNKVLSILTGLNKHPDKFVLHSIDDRSYSFDWYKAKNMLKERALFGCIKQLYGIKAARIWTLLITIFQENPTTCLDIEEISKRAVVSIQNARAILYQLTIKGFAKLQEPDSNHKIANPTDRQQFYFTSSVDSTHSQIIKNSYKFGSNLLERLVHEKNSNFRRHLMVDDNSLDVTGEANCGVIEIHLIYVIKFIVIMQQLQTFSKS
ncbi:RNA polymerase III subunit RPC82 helix-turn-helix domain-containing protein [Theileria equi strain WA]|uniref:DNA-directed RNA polymerase III subunit RPC3 n=1 Tax=Theileria equi strain WA TaxID=1537102 RepID=L0AZZ3_THEEQ|nr:RNA polymerase III subunit RPC82 helix-turn-helix domain-containing protein [Theileria equi strain WA]AFZ81140.1 RNA polymerase III subunit RPC82 helix-turn-helix domain-containing protein [Theileria equi strain WA]|eukprot:XP_004830806.1 RNA polymerase III subunit RPC82 helix-turn-helix domain-containing protein [Theileria equi strain WA]